MWYHWLCSLWKWCSWKFPYWFWFLRTILANWLCQRLYCRPPYWSLPGEISIPHSQKTCSLYLNTQDNNLTITNECHDLGFLPTFIWICGGSLQRAMVRQQIHHLRIRCASSMLWRLQRQLVQVGVENSICCSDSRDCHDIPLLQWLLGFDRGSIVLSINCLLPNRDAHCPEKDTKVFFHMGMAENSKLDLPDCITCCSCWIYPGSCHFSQALQAFLNSTISSQNCSN